MGRKYRNPPLVEALCEFLFEPSQPWDITVPGLFYEKVRKEFPIKRQQEMLEMEFRFHQAAMEQKMRGGITRVQFWRADETALTQIGPDFLAVNHLKPYPTWDVFLPLILKLFTIYRELAKPEGLRRVSLRYINHIEVCKDISELGRYFRFYPPQLEGLTKLYDNFLIRVEISYNGGRDSLFLTAGRAQPQDQNMMAVLLDLEYAMKELHGIHLEEVKEWLQEAHDQIERAFEACITDEARILFEEIEG